MFNFDSCFHISIKPLILLHMFNLPLSLTSLLYLSVPINNLSFNSRITFHLYISHFKPYLYLVFIYFDPSYNLCMFFSSLPHSNFLTLFHISLLSFVTKFILLRCSLYVSINLFPSTSNMSNRIFPRTILNSYIVLVYFPFKFKSHNSFRFQILSS